MGLDATATALFDAQAGVVTRQQLLVAGYTGARIDGMLRRRDLERVGYGVYRRTASGRSPQQDELIAVLRCGPGARVTGPRLLGHLGVEGFSLDDPFVVLVPRRCRVAGVSYPVRRDLAPELHRASYGPVAGTTPARTLVEMAVDAARSDDELLAVYDRVRWRGVANQVRMAAVVDALPRHPGARRLARLLGTTAAVTESPGERRLERVLAPVEPPLEWQVWLAPDLRVDALWRDVALVVEYQGAGTHEEPRDRDHDRQRHARLRTMGYEVVVVDRHDLRDPATLVARLLAARAIRRDELRRLA